eukprot:scaffold3337_cov169-Amphora_coffeaeformis.AAC.20
MYVVKRQPALTQGQHPKKFRDNRLQDSGLGGCRCLFLCFPAELLDEKEGRLAVSSQQNPQVAKKH